MPRVNWLRDPTDQAVKKMFGTGKEINLADLSRRSGVAYQTCAAYRNRNSDFAACRLETFAKLCEGRELSDQEIIDLIKTFYGRKRK